MLNSGGTMSAAWGGHDDLFQQSHDLHKVLNRFQVAEQKRNTDFLFITCLDFRMNIPDILARIVEIVQVVCHSIDLESDTIELCKVKCECGFSVQLPLNKCLSKIKSDFTNIIHCDNRNGIVFKEPFVIISNGMLCKETPRAFIS